MSALDVQVGGDHYKKLKIQPVEYIHANSIPFIEGCIIKYASRWRDKGGIKDLEKIKHFAELLIDLETRAAEAESLASLAIGAEPALEIDDESPRAQAIGQNGNTGEHYDLCLPTWDDAPSWANYLAQDKAGTWCWYEDKPQLSKGRWIVQDNGKQWMMSEFSTSSYCWMKSLEARPCQ